MKPDERARQMRDLSPEERTRAIRAADNVVDARQLFRARMEDGA